MMKHAVSPLILIPVINIDVVFNFIQVSCSLMDQTKDAEVLPSYEDEHGGIIVEMKEPMDPNDFALMLRYSLSQWKLQVIMAFHFGITESQATATCVLHDPKSAIWITVLSYDLTEISICPFSLFRLSGSQSCMSQVS